VSSFSHQSRRARYQPTVAASPSSSERSGRQPSSRLILPQSTAAVMPRAIRDEADERRRLAQIGQDGRRDLKVRPLARPSDVVDLAGAPRVQDKVQSPAVVLHVQPVADGEPIAVDGQRLPSEGLDDERRDELLRVLVGPVVVRAAGHDHPQPEGVVVGPDQKVGPGLARRVGAVRPERTLLGEGAPWAEGAVDLVRGDLDEPRHPGRPGRLKEHLGPQNVRADEDLRSGDAAVHVGLGREVHDGIHAGGQPAHQSPVGDVAPDELVPLVTGDFGETIGVARVGQLVEVHHPVRRMAPQEVAHEVRADEPGATGHQDGSTRGPPPLSPTHRAAPSRRGCRTDAGRDGTRPAARAGRPRWGS